MVTPPAVSPAPIPGPHWLVAPLDFGGTFLWALSGALIGVRRGYDAVGTFIVALLSAAGGGLLRDSIFLQQGPPVLVTDWRYISIIILAFAAVALFGTRTAGVSPLVTLMDAVGVGMYAVVGMERAMEVGLSLFGVVLVGVANATGGAMLRDIVVREEPGVLRPGEYYASLAVVGCILFIVLIKLHVPTVVAAWATIALVFILRLLAVRYGWHTRPLSGLFPRRQTRPD